MRLKDLVLTGFLSLPFLASCVTENITKIDTVKTEFYPIGISGYMNREALEYKAQKIEIIMLRDNGKKYHLVFASKNPELIGFLHKKYGLSEKIIFVTNEKTEEIILD